MKSRLKLSAMLARIAEMHEIEKVVVEGIVTQRHREETDRKEWALVSKKPHANTGKRRVLKWFGKKKPTEEEIEKEEQRVQFYKHKGE